jgi:primary-amine oxidase
MIAFHLRLLCLLLLLSSVSFAQLFNFAHPLDPLTKEEIVLAAQVLKESGKTTTASRFSIINLHEPPKAEVLNHQPGAPFRREAIAVVYERASNKTFEAVVDLRARTVLSWREMPGVQPTFLVEDDFLVQTIIRPHPEWQAGLKKRGITDFSTVAIDTWAVGNFGFKEEEGKRLYRCVPYLRGSSKLHYTRPIEGLFALVDVSGKQVLRVIDTGVVPVAPTTTDVDEGSVGPLRAAPKPLQIVQPEGVSFEVRGHEVRWQKWRFRYALHPREGLVLYTVGYEDQGRVRPILYRASLSEMVVPYGDPSEGWFFRNAFDEGEYGLGRLAVSLEDKTDVPGNALLLDAVFPDEIGGALAAPRRVGLFERDGGLSWKHVDYLTNQNQSRRARQLVLSCFTVIGNYDYGFNWVFHQDGTLEMETLLTGAMSMKGVPPLNAETGHQHSDFWHLVADGVAAPHHQHFFNFRLDFDVDGTNNSVVEQNTMALPPGKNNLYGSGFVMRETPLRREAEAQRQVNLATQRRWRITNPSVRNALGQPVSYALVTGENSVPYASLSSSLRKRAGFLNAHVWVTQQQPDELYAAGYYINQSKGGAGLARWVKQNRPLENQDVVLWYTFGVTHLPRPEDYPVMPVHKTGFKLAPLGFFARNPALDVPK